MGLTVRSSGRFAIDKDKPNTNVELGTVRVALAGNPNVGKSTLFNRLTGKKRHTGNWPGKTVGSAIGLYKKGNKKYAVFDLPGTYSLMAHSAEEEIARDFLCFENPDVTVVVCDATCLERNLNLVLQVSEIFEKVIVAVNLLDEARKKGITLNLKALEEKLGLPVFGICARNGEGIDELTTAIENYKNLNYNPLKVVYKKEIEQSAENINMYLSGFISQKENTKWVALKLVENDNSLMNSFEKYFKIDFANNENLQKILLKEREKLNLIGISEDKFKDWLVSGLVLTAEDICDSSVVNYTNPDYRNKDLKADRFLTGRVTGLFVMIALLGVIFWLTIVGANYPSDLLWKLFSFLEKKLLFFANTINLPTVISDMLICGVYRVLSWVISVMLPPMAIFFPFFTLLEDVGYLPRIAFNMDHGFKKCSACGKQALTMCMGFGCNAVGVTGCRIIDSPRERLMAILTNSFVPCNGRFPILTAMVTMFFMVGKNMGSSFISALIITLMILMGIGVTFAVSKFLSLTFLKGEASSFTLELPPYRKPKIRSVIFRSICDRTVFVLGRAVSVAAPAGLIIWIFANLKISGNTFLDILSGFLDPLGKVMRLDGVIILGFILGFPANEIVIPIIVMAYMSQGTLSHYNSLEELKILLLSNGWDWTTAVSMIMFSLFHWPCSTTLITVKKESGSWGWTYLAFVLPTAIGIFVCVIWNCICNIIF